MSRALMSLWQRLLAGCAAPNLRAALQVEAQPAQFATPPWQGDRA